MRYAWIRKNTDVEFATFLQQIIHRHINKNKVVFWRLQINIIVYGQYSWRCNICNTVQGSDEQQCFNEMAMSNKCYICSPLSGAAGFKQSNIWTVINMA